MLVFRLDAEDVCRWVHWNQRLHIHGDSIARTEVSRGCDWIGDNLSCGETTWHD